MKAPFTHQLRVRYGECDPQGVVFNANYHLYFDVAFTEMWREVVGPWSELEALGVDGVVAATGAHFRAPARFDDVVTLETRIEHVGSTSLIVRIRALRDRTLLAECELRYVFIDNRTWRKTPIPDSIRPLLERHLETA